MRFDNRFSFLWRASAWRLTEPGFNRMVVPSLSFQPKYHRRWEPAECRTIKSSTCAGFLPLCKIKRNYFRCISFIDARLPYHRLKCVVHTAILAPFDVRTIPAVIGISGSEFSFVEILCSCSSFLQVGSQAVVLRAAKPEHDYARCQAGQ